MLFYHPDLVYEIVVYNVPKSMKLQDSFIKIISRKHLHSSRSEKK